MLELYTTLYCEQSFEVNDRKKYCYIVLIDWRKEFVY
jgi:hypothetical protein